MRGRKTNTKIEEIIDSFRRDVLAIAIVITVIGMLAALSSWTFLGSIINRPQEAMMPPSLELVVRRIAEGDLAFKRRSYKEAGILYISALHYIEALKASDANHGRIEDIPSHNYLEASLEVRIRLATIGNTVAERRE